MLTNPATLGRFQILRTLGSSSEHVVHLAVDPATGSKVAVKSLLHPQASADAFDREWAISRALRHPGVLKPLERGHDDRAGTFLVTEYVEGQSLEELAAGPLPARTGLHLLVQLLRILEACEADGVLHGDITPANVWIDAAGRVRLMDFGSGIPSKSDPGEERVYATPGYAAPEILRGEAPSPASELFAFATTAFHVFTGAPPFPGDSPEARILATLEQEPRLPEQLPEPMHLVFSKALHREASQRFADLRAFMGVLIAAVPLEETDLEELLGFLDGVPMAYPGLDGTARGRVGARPTFGVRVSTQPMPGPGAAPQGPAPIGKRVAALEAILAGSPGVRDFAVFDARDGILAKSARAGSLLQVAPSMYFSLSENAGTAAEAGALRSILLRSRDGRRCLLYRAGDLAVAVDLEPGIHPAELIASTLAP